MAREIILNTGSIAIVDDEDYETVSRHKWTQNNKGYAITSMKIDGKWCTVSMHRFLNKTPPELQTDHRDGDRLNNRKENLRNCSFQGNNRNKGFSKNNKSGMKGVHVRKVSRYMYWKSAIRIDSKIKVKLFPYTDEGKLQAAKWYDEQAKIHYGEFAKVNGA